MTGEPLRRWWDPRRWDLSKVVLVLVIGVLVTLFVGGVVVVPRILNTDSGVAAVRDGTDLQACRSKRNAAVQDAFGEQIGATAALTAAKARLDILTNAGLEASVRQDAVALGFIVAAAPVYRAQVEESARQADAADRTRKDAKREYDRALQNSIDDPVGFVKRCRESG